MYLVVKLWWVNAHTKDEAKDTVSLSVYNEHLDKIGDSTTLIIINTKDPIYSDVLKLLDAIRNIVSKANPTS